jgi:hypothetical protein
MNLAWTASTDAVGVTGYAIWRNGVGVGTTAALTFADTTVLPSTTYSYVIRATDAAGNISVGSNQVSVTTPAAPAQGLVVDSLVTTRQTSNATSITSPPLSTGVGSTVLVAFISSDGPSSGAQRISSVVTAGLTWKLRQRSNAQRGTAEIWQANASSAFTNITVRANRASGSYQGMITVVAFRGASTAVSGAVTAANGATGAPTVQVTTTRALSWVWGVGIDWDRPVTRTVGANQTIVAELLSPSGDTMWLQCQTSVTPVAGTTVTINDLAPTNDRWNLAAIEIVAQ